MGDASNTFGWASASEQSLVAPHLEYMRKNRFILDFAGLPALLTDAYPDAPTVLRLNCASASRPEITFEETKVERINGRVKLAGKPEYGDVTIAFYDSLKQRTFTTDTAGAVAISSCSDVLEAWRELIYQPNLGDAFGAAANYKGLAYLHMLEPQNVTPTSDDTEPTFDELPATQAITQTWLMQGLFPKSIKFGELAYESSDVCQVEVTFSVDRYFRVKPKGV